MRSLAFWTAALSLISGCDSGSEPPPDGDAAVVDADACDDCDDGVFCNGLETCEDGVCVPGDAPCGEGTSCNESDRRCVGECSAESADADGDGVDSIDCGGEDCDDDDPDRHPGNTEVCDPDGIDEDCDPSTVGERDVDGDGFVDAECCNGDQCGTDCNDMSASISPEANEVCNDIDDDCDFMVDEGSLTAYVVDEDGDGHGSDEEGADVRMACSQPAGFAESADDCNDDDNAINPGVSEECDDGEVDENCDGLINDDCDCSSGESRNCRGFGICATGVQDCVDGRWLSCSIRPTNEVCWNDADENCNGELNDGCGCMPGTSDCDTDAGTCELVHGEAENSCATPQSLGSVCGDGHCRTFCPSSSWATGRTATGYSSKFFSLRTEECSSCPGANIYGRLTLIVPEGVNYDLHLFQAGSCGGVPVQSSVLPSGRDDTVEWSRSDSVGNCDVFDWIAEVRHVNGESCEPWTLTFQGRDCDAGCEE